MVEAVAVAVGVSIAVSAASAALVAELTPTQTIDRGGLSDLSVPKSNYGAAIPQCWGEVAVVGNLIWTTPKREKVITKTKGGGLFSPKIKTKKREYYITFVVEFAYCPHRPVEGIQQLDLNGQRRCDFTDPSPQAVEATTIFASSYLRFYNGDLNQSVDPLMKFLTPTQTFDYGLPHNKNDREALLNSLGLSGNLNHIPAYRKKCYLMFENIILGPFNNALPRVKANLLFNSNNTLETIVTDICNQSNITNFDASALGSIPVAGFINKDLTSAKQALQKLQQAYFFDILKVGNVLKFIPYDSLRPTIPIPSTNLASHQGGQGRPKTFEITKPDPDSLPESVEVTFIDSSSNQEPGMVVARSQIATSKRVESYTFPIVMTGEEAQKIADNLLFQFYLKAMKPSTLQLSRKYAYLEVGDRLEVEFYGEPYILQITRIAWGANLLMKVDTEVVEAANVTNISAPPPAIIPNSYNPPTPEIVTQGDTNLIVMDINLINDTDEDYEVYVSASGGTNWRECSLYMSSDDVSYYFVDTLEGVGTIGTLASNLDGSSTNAQVSLQSGELESISTVDYDSGANRLLVGNEILQFQNVTDNGNNKELSTLRRGIRGTETFINSHVLGERVVLLSGNGASIERTPGTQNDIGQVRYFKALSPGQTLDQVNPIAITIEGNALKPYAPVNLAATVDSVGNITVTWDRRDRRAGDATVYNNLPLSEFEEKWEIEIIDDSGVAVRTQALSNNRFVYTSLEQTDDFASTQDSITVNIYQISASIGRGYEAHATLTPTFFQPDPALANIYPNPANLNDLITIEGTGLNQINAVFFSDLFPAAEDLTIVSDNKITFRFTSNGFIGQTQPINFIKNFPGLPNNPSPDLINEFTSFKLTISSSGSGSGFTGFVVVTESRNLEDDDFGKILILDTTVNDADIELTLDETLLTDTENFNFSAIKLGFYEGIFLNTANNQLIAKDNKLVDDRTGASWFLQEPNIWYGLGALGGIDLANYMQKAVYDPDEDGVIQASVDTSDFMLKTQYDSDNDGYADVNLDLSEYLTASEIADTYMATNDYIDNGLIKPEKVPLIIYETVQDNNNNYTLTPTDINKDFRLNNRTKTIYIPTSNIGFVNGWNCLVSLSGEGNISIKRANNSYNGLLFSGGQTFTQLKTQGTVSIRHLANNIWFVNGYLEED